MSPHSAPVPGAWHRLPEREIDADHVAQFAAAVGESDPAFLAGRRVVTTYPITFGWQLQNELQHDVAPGDGLGLHGEQAFRFHGRLAPGMRVKIQARVESVVQRRSGTTVTTYTQTSSEGDLLCEQLFTVYYVGAFLPSAGTERAPWPEQGGGDSSGNGELLRRATEMIEPATVGRYAEAAGDHYAIHLDDGYARSRGLSGVIVHGMCTLGFAARQVRETCSDHALGEITALRSRFEAPVLPGRALTTSVYGPGVDRRTGAFRATVAGEVVLTGAYAAGELG